MDNSNGETFRKNNESWNVVTDNEGRARWPALHAKYN